ncbi:MAG: GNAT family N-acetyltransferase [Planctomycetaceae bacterium]
MRYTTNRATVDQVLQHLRNCQAAFIPPLNERVDVASYAAKVSENAETFEAWEDDLLIGLVAAYLKPDRCRDTGFITSVSILNSHTRRGVARQLMQQCEQRAVELRLSGLRLEVAGTNTAAVGLYQSLGYTETEVNGPTLVMTRRTESNA